MDKVRTTLKLCAKFVVASVVVILLILPVGFCCQKVLNGVLKLWNIMFTWSKHACGSIMDCTASVHPLVDLVTPDDADVARYLFVIELMPLPALPVAPVSPLSP